MNEVVKYNNILNSVNFRNFTENDFDLLMCICARMRDLGEQTQVFDYAYLMDLVNWDKTQRIDLFHEELKRMSDKLRQIGGVIDITPDEFVCFNLFTTFRGNRQKKHLTVNVNPDFAYVLNDLTNNFTRFELSEYVHLSGRYSKQLYQSLKQYRNAGWWQISLEDIRHRLSIPDSMETRNIKPKILNSSIETIRSCKGFSDLNVDVVRSRERGRAVTGYKFTWTTAKQVKGQQGFRDSESLDDYMQNAGMTKKKSQKPKKTKNDFNNFQQNDYDFEALEKTLLKN